jgi:hypothetical protein
MIHLGLAFPGDEGYNSTLHEDLLSKAYNRDLNLNPKTSPQRSVNREGGNSGSSLDSILLSKTCRKSGD